MPGVIEMKISAEYWIWQTTNLSDDSASARLSGFLAMHQSWLVDNKPMTDLSDLMREYEERLPAAKKHNKAPMLALYYLFNSELGNEMRSCRYEKMLRQHKTDLDKRQIEMLVVRWLESGRLPWPVEDCATVLDEFDPGRFLKRTIEIPVRIELAMMLAVRNDYLRIGQSDDYERWTNRAYLEATGMKDVQGEIDKCRQENAVIDPISIATRGRMKMDMLDEQSAKTQVILCGE